MPFRSMYTLFLVFCISVFGAMTAQASADETCPHPAFHITGIEVSARGASGEEARQLATEDGIVQAWRKLTQRLLLEKLDNDTASDKQEMVDYIRIERETVLPKRYLATFDYCFDRGRVRAYFAERKANHAELISAPMLVLPVWNAAGQARIWRKPNPWAMAWEQVLEGRNGLVQLRMTEKLATERAVSPGEVAALEPGVIARAAELERAEKVIVARITPVADGDNMTASVTASLYGRDGGQEAEIFELKKLVFPVGKTPETMRWLASEIENGVERVWRSVNMVTVNEASQITLHITSDTITEWRSTLRQLKGLATVEDLLVVQLNHNGGVVRLNLSGSIQSLVYSLEPGGLAIEPATSDDGTTFLKLIHRDT